MIMDDQEYVQIPNFSNYVISIHTFKVMNLSKNCEVLPLKNSKKVKFKLSKCGVTYYLTLFQILHSVIYSKEKTKS